MNRRVHASLPSLLLLLVLLAPPAAFVASPAHAQLPDWDPLRPSNTGIPGEEVRFARFDPEGRLWVGARWPFWQEGGLGILDRQTGTWEVHANFETPIPSEYVNDIAFAPDGTVWIATHEGLVQKNGSDWTVFTTANSPLLHNTIAGVELDSDGHVWVNNTRVTDNLAGLFEYTGELWNQWTVPDDIPFPDPWRALRSLHIDADDRVWVANSVMPGLAEYDGVS